MGMVIIIAVAAIWGVYEVGNSVMFRNSGDVMTKEHNSVIEFIKATDNKELRKQRIKLYLNEERITQEESNKLY